MEKFPRSEEKLFGHVLQTKHTLQWTLDVSAPLSVTLIPNLASFYESLRVTLRVCITTLLNVSASIQIVPSIAKLSVDCHIVSSVLEVWL